MTTRTRFGYLARVFEGGTSPVLNHIGRLSVLYEDLRIERGALIDEIGKPETRQRQYRVIYFTRRSLATLMEYKSGLSQLTALREFKDAHISERDAEAISRSNRYFHANGARIKELRNEVGGHVQGRSITFAVSNFGADHVGSVCWDSSRIETDALCLELHYAGDLIAGAIASRIDPSKSVQDEISAALRVIIDGYVEVQRATYGLVHGFLWDRFGV